MRSMGVRRSVFGAMIALWAGSAVAWATPIPVGAGVNNATMAIEFSDGALYEFDICFGATESDTETGLGLFDILEANTSLTTLRTTYTFGTFVDGISYDGHSNSGFYSGEDWWHYWIKDSGDTNWLAPSYGVSDRTITDGDSDGWVYGKAYAPGEAPEPATATLLATLISLALFRRR